MDVLDAMKMGIIPIYYKIKNEFDIDISGKNNKWNIKAETPINFYQQIKNITMSKEKLLRLQRSVIIYSNNYFTFFNEKKFHTLFCQIK